MRRREGRKEGEGETMMGRKEENEKRRRRRRRRKGRRLRKTKKRKERKIECKRGGEQHLFH